MKINSKRIAALLLVVVLALSFAACTKKATNDNVVNATFSDHLVAEKIGTVNRDSFTTRKGGLTYQDYDTKTYGVISYEGLYDTGAIFSYVSEKEDCFMVRENDPVNEDDIARINSAYLINGRGYQVVPGPHAAFEILNNRYVLVADATQRTYSAEKAVLTYKSDTKSTHTTSYIVAEDEDWYEGTWVIYDVVKQDIVPGAVGDRYMKISTNGNFIRITDPETREVLYINFNGEAVPEDAKVFSDGSFSIEGRIGEVYSADGTKLFDYDLTGYIPETVSGDYYVASKYVDGAFVYAIMDKSGNILSEGYAEMPYVYGRVVQCGNKVYNINGENIIEGTYTSVYADKVFGNNWLLNYNDEYTVIDDKGKIYFTDSDKKLNMWSTDFVAAKEIDGENYIYSYKDQDYTIKGGVFAPWIAVTYNANDRRDLVDTMTGENLLEGYERYESIAYGPYAYYVYGIYNGGADVYFVVSASQISEVTETKANLYEDLQAAFNAEGIEVSINKENDEIALDTAVLFGGDSAVLTNEGKAILNKFIKAYSNVVYSEKYNGFITKTLVEGHAAPLANSTYASGYSLSVERATNVMNYCLSAEAGVDSASPIANTLEAVGYSNSQPIYNEDGTVNLEASRRVSFCFMVNIDI